jgi:hypothetical protein
VSKKYNYLIEVRVPNGSEGWKQVVNDEMSQAIKNLKAVVEELGGKLCVRY